MKLPHSPTFLPFPTSYIQQHEGEILINQDWHPADIIAALRKKAPPCLRFHARRVYVQPP